MYNIILCNYHSFPAYLDDRYMSKTAKNINIASQFFPPSGIFSSNVFSKQFALLVAVRIAKQTFSRSKESIYRAFYLVAQTKWNCKREHTIPFSRIHGYRVPIVCLRI